jgi:glutamyl-Q tRNA(Asp) synthetase
MKRRALTSPFRDHDDFTMSFTTRFAPSPTGRLHLGHAFSALTAFDAARRNGGRFLLRFEDIDQTRCRPEYEEGIIEDLTWLGIRWDGPIRRQSEHFENYADILDRLARKGLAYRCFRTRRDIAEESTRAPHRPIGDTAHADTGSASADRGDAAAGQDAARPFAWRLSMAACRALLQDTFSSLGFVETGVGPEGQNGLIAATPDIAGDVIIGRKDCPASYHLACVHDDALQGVTHVIRGNDLFGATHVHVLLQRLLGYETPIYRHHGLLTGPDGKRYAKRNLSVTLRDLRSQGASPDDIRERIGRLR